MRRKPMVDVVRSRSRVSLCWISGWSSTMVWFMACPCGSRDDSRLDARTPLRHPAAKWNGAEELGMDAALAQDSRLLGSDEIVQYRREGWVLLKGLLGP